MAIQDRNEQRNGPFGNLDVAIYLLFVTLHLALLDRLPDSLLDTFSLQIILNSGKNILLLVDVDKQLSSSGPGHGQVQLNSTLQLYLSSQIQKAWT